MTDEIVTDAHIDAIRAAHRTIMGEVDQMKAACLSQDERDKLEPFGPPGYHRRRLAELCPAALEAYDRFLEDRREAGKRIDPHTCRWSVTYIDLIDPYGILGVGYYIGRDFVVGDDNSDGPIESIHLSDEQAAALRERIEREAKKAVLSSVVGTPSGFQLMPMPSSRDPEAAQEEILLEEYLKNHHEEAAGRQYEDS